MTEQPILYSFRRCPYAMRARIAMFLSGYSCELREVILSKKPKEMVELSPKGTVPVLVLSSGEIIDESLDVMRYVFGRNDKLGILRQYNRYQNEMDPIISLFDGKFKYHLDRYKYASRYKEIDHLEHREKAMNCLEALTSGFLEKSNYLYGNSLSFLDIALLPFIRQYRIADPQWFDNEMPFISIRTWLHNFLDSEVLRRVMQKYQVWSNESTGVVFP